MPSSTFELKLDSRFTTCIHVLPGNLLSSLLDSDCVKIKGLKIKERERTMKRIILALVLALVPGGQMLWAAPAENEQLDQRALQRITKEVHHELVLLPYYGVFDNLAYQVSPDGTVTLIGQVVRPSTKSSAQAAVKNIEGVRQVVNQIDVLPPSPLDDGIRRRVYRAIYGNSVLSRYAIMAVPPIHIIVKNGHVTLTGVVDRQMDKQVAEIQAKSVPNVFSVEDQLQVVESK
jgi:hyperosmotically inducible protein